jgi:hypothetical protein
MMPKPSKVDLLVGRTTLAFMGADELELDQHVQAFERLVNNLKARLENRYALAEQLKHHGSIVVD